MEVKLPKKMRKHLCLPSLLRVVRQGFKKVPDPISRKATISLVDCLMSGVALFGLKYPSLPLNDTHTDTEVTVLEYREEGKSGDKKYFCWITDLEVNEKTVEQLVCGGRARWRIENETFNTLKNQGYQFEHNFGHGNNQLSTVLVYLMFIAFLMDQIQEFACNTFKAVLVKYGGRSYVWQKMRGLFFHFFIDTWEQLYEVLLGRGRDIWISELLDSS